MTLFFNTGLFYTVLSNTFLVQRRNTNTVNNQAFFISHLRLVSLFFKECWEPGFTGFVKGRFPFSQNFRKFRLGRKWKTFRRFVQMEIPGKSGKSKKVARFPGWNFPNGILCSIYTFLILYTSSNCYQLGSHLNVLSGNGLGGVPGFTIK